MRNLSGILFFTFLLFLFTPFLGGESVPYFSFSDQYGNQLTSNSLKGNTSIILGCEVSDIDLCRKIGRNIYWKMQNLLGKDSTKIKFTLYLNMTSTNAILEKYIEESKTKEFESIFLDRQGDLKIGLKKDHAYLRIFNRQGKEIHNEYLDAVDLTKINELHEILKKNI